MFAVTSERTKYQPSLGTYSGEHALCLFLFVYICYFFPSLTACHKFLLLQFISRPKNPVS